MPYEFYDDEQPEQSSSSPEPVSSSEKVGELADKPLANDSGSSGGKYFAELGASASIPGVVDLETPSVSLLYDPKKDQVGAKLCAPSLGLGGASVGVKFGGLGYETGGLAEGFDVGPDVKLEVWAAYYGGLSGAGSLSGGVQGLSSGAEVSLIAGIGAGAGVSQKFCVTVNLSDAKASAVERVDRTAEGLGRSVWEFEQDLMSRMTFRWPY